MTKLVTDTDFVTAWQHSSSIVEVQSKTGLSYATCSQRATKLRKAKVNLKRFPRKKGVEPVDTKGLNKLIASMNKKK